MTRTQTERGKDLIEYYCAEETDTPIPAADCASVQADRVDILAYGKRIRVRLPDGSVRTVVDDVLIAEYDARGVLTHYLPR